MRRRKIVLGTLSLLTVAAIGAGATLAYFTDSDEATNVVTMGHVDIDLTEPKYDEVYENRTVNDVVPNQVIEKDPTITVDKDSEDCYVRATLTIGGLEGLTTTGGNSYAEMLLAGINIDTTKWYLGSDGYYYYNKKMKPEESTQLFTTVSIPEKWGNEVVDKELKIVVSAEAIQADNFTPTTADGMITAWTYEDGTAITAETYNANSTTNP